MKSETKKHDKITSLASDRSLISLVKTYPMLYDKTDPDYRDPQLKRKTWNSVAAVLTEIARTSSNPREFEGIECKDRWLALKDRFTKERSRLDDLLTPENDLPQGVSVFPLYKDLQFLDSYIIRRSKRKRKFRSSNEEYQSKSQNFGIESGDEYYESTFEDSNLHNPLETNEVIEENTPSKEIQVITLTASDSTKRKKLAKTESKVPNDDDDKTTVLTKSIDKLTNVMLSKSKLEEDAELKSFCEIVYHQLLDVDKKKRLSYQLAILQAIQQLHNQ